MLRARICLASFYLRKEEIKNKINKIGVLYLGLIFYGAPSDLYGSGGGFFSEV